MVLYSPKTSIVAPSVIIILIIAMFLDKFRKNKYVDSAFYGIRPASTAMIASALLGLLALCLFGAGSVAGIFTEALTISPKAWILFAVLMVLTNTKKLKDLHPLIYRGVCRDRNHFQICRSLRRSFL